jgi:hypothetical protein
MASGPLIVAHRSGASQLDIIVEKQTGELAFDADSYALAMHDLLTLTCDERRQRQEQVRADLQRFCSSNFERCFIELVDSFLCAK